MAIGIANFQTLFQTFYPEKDFSYLIPKNLVLLNALPKSSEISGDVTDHPFLFGTPQGYSMDFNTAMTQASSAPQAARASIRLSQAYKALEFFDKDVMLSQGTASYGDLFEKTVSGAFRDFYNQLDLDLHGSGTGWRGTVIALPNTVNPKNGQTLPANTIALSAAYSLEATFTPSQQLQLVTYANYPTANSIFPPSDGRLPTTVSPVVQVLAVDANAGTLLLSDASAATLTSFVVQAGGALGFSTGNLNGGLIGLDSWNPYGGVATNDAFVGVNRSAYGTRLAGYYLDGSKLSIEDAVKRLSAIMSQGGATESNLCLMHPLDIDALDSKLGSFVRYSTYDTANYGFDAIVITGAAGRLSVVSDSHQPRGYARIVDVSTWLLRHADALPHVVDVGGKTVEQAVNFDGRTARLRGYMQLFCMEPHKNGIVKLPSTLVG